jgi:aspartate/methionine/tyrosine aminotransferase
MFHPFQVEQFLSENEQGVTYNFSESGVHPMELGGLLEMGGTSIETLSGLLLDYPEVRGTELLRTRIAALYPGATADNVLVTVGASEANHLIASTLLQPGDEIIALSPTYQQLPGNAQNAGVTVKAVPLVEENDWALDIHALARAVGPKTRLIAIVNPNNPTGHILTAAERSAVIAAAARTGAWIISDEVYAGTERGGASVTPSFWGCYDRVIAVNGMSKAYGLPGLRLGWLVAPKDQVPALWRRHEYSTISATMLGNTLGEIALDPAVRPKLTARARRLIDTGFDRLAEGLSHYQGVFSVVPPQASAMSFVRYNLPIDSRDLAFRLRHEKDMLVVPGDCFGLEHHFRFSSALPEDHLIEGLARLNALVHELLER